MHLETRTCQQLQILFCMSWLKKPKKRGFVVIEEGWEKLLRKLTRGGEGNPAPPLE